MASGPDIQLDRLDENLRSTLMVVCRLIADAGGRAWMVGGSVRDCALGLDPGDLDLEVFGLSAAELSRVLATRFQLDLVGQAWGILKVKGWPIDVGLPRRESKIGLGHKGFETKSDPSMSVEDASARRDFTINSIYFDPLLNEVQDPWHGLPDLEGKILRHTSDAFSEDPLRVLRAMQLAARFDFQVAPETVALCRSIGMEGLPPERIFEEWRKLIVLGDRPSCGLAFLDDCGWIVHFPELAALRGVPQDPNWHPEGDVWVHTLHCMDAFAGEKIGDEWEDLVVGFAVLCHDFGKPETTLETDGKIRAWKHESVSADLTANFLERMTSNRKLIAAVVPLVAEHMRPSQLHDAGASGTAVRRLSMRVQRIDRLVRVARADAFGRPPLPSDDYPPGDWLLEKAAEQGVLKEAPVPLVQGRDLIAIGLEPGPEFSTILQACYEAQVNGRFDTAEDGRAFAAKLIEGR